jgi:hypothetical protein
VDEQMTLLLPVREMWIAEILARAGLGDSADRVAARVTTNPPSAWRPRLFYEAAYLRILRQDPDSALALIAIVVRRDPTFRRAFEVPWFATLRADPRFAQAAAGGPVPRSK